MYQQEKEKKQMIKFMRNYKNNTENNEEDNKGFSLVELIIVIAIMAILVAVLAPQFLQYVERSRNSTDATNATSIVAAVQTYIADPANAGDVKGFTGGTVAVSSSGYTADGVLKKALEAAGYASEDSISCKSTSAWTDYSIVFTYSNGNLAFVYEGTTFASYMKTGSVSTTTGG